MLQSFNALFPPWFRALEMKAKILGKSLPLFRGIEWSLRAFASMRAVRLFLRARAVIKYVLRAASTLKLIQMASSEHFINFLGGI